jgi:hypothetical protein
MNSFGEHHIKRIEAHALKLSFYGSPPPPSPRHSPSQHIDKGHLLFFSVVFPFSVWQVVALPALISRGGLGADATKSLVFFNKSCS